MSFPDLSALVPREGEASEAELFRAEGFKVSGFRVG